MSISADASKQQLRRALADRGQRLDLDLDLDLDQGTDPAAGADSVPDMAALENLADQADAAERRTASGYRVASDTAQGRAITDDMARMFRSLGVVSFRAAVVDIDSLSFHSNWTVHSTGGWHDGASDASALEGAFPGAAGTVARLSATPIDTTLVQRMSPRRWVFAWRIDERRAVMAMAHFLEGRIAMAPVDTAVVRLVCDAGIQAEQAAPPRPAAAPETKGPAWPQVERRRRVVPRWMRGPALALVCLATALVFWLGLVALPQARQEAEQGQAELDRLRTMADRTVVRSVAAAMASGDYGEVQIALTGFATLGYFEQAVVTNTAQRVVAIEGPVSGARIGDPPPADLLSRARATPLMQGTAPNGQLLVYSPSAADAQALTLDRLQWLGLLALAVLAATLPMMALGWPRRRQPRPRAPASPR